MREPTRRRTQTTLPAVSGHRAQLRKLFFSIRMLSAASLSAALCAAPVALAADTVAEAPKPAVKSELASHTLLLDVAAAGDRLVAVGSRGHIVYSDDQGASWTQAEVPARQLLTSVFFVDANNGWAVGHDSVILHTSDAGTNWEMQYRDPELDMPEDPNGPGLLERPLMDVWFRDANTGFAFGAYGIYLRTDDGGESWEDLSFDIDNPDGFHYNAVTAVEGAGLLLAGEMGTLYRSPDYGDTWETLQNSPYDGTWFGAAGTGEANQVLVWGLRGNMFRSTDFGDSWEQVELHTPNNGPLEATLLGGTLSAGDSLAVVGAGGVVLTSNNHGESFDVAVRPDRVALATAKYLPDGQMLLVGQHGVVKASPKGLPNIQ
ncbi:MAG: YCF48-related protein [Pseudomonas sp.]|uniref:WD40/YVTN/BNR-like repeat-containing protein n=1 Tax=Pseudomonas sp. TaxID=306 RepID=UPI0032426C68